MDHIVDETYVINMDKETTKLKSFNDIVDETYVINMDKETTRLKTFDNMMISKYNNSKWNYIRMPAINGKDLRNNLVTTYRISEDDLQLINCKATINIQDELLQNSSHIYEEQIGYNLINPDIRKFISFKRKYIKDANWLTTGEEGCLLSHVYLWEKVATNPNLNRIIVFEDDARTQMDIVMIQELILELYKHFNINSIEEPDMLYLGKALDACIRYEHIWNNVYKSYHPLCLHAYLITKQGAQKLLKRAPYDNAIDVIPIHAIANKVLNVMVFHPSLYFQDIINNTSSLRELGRSLNTTSECLIELQHISESDMNYIGVIFIALIVVIILYLLYTFVWNK